ncbi:MAG: energy-coupling factor transporter ATPase [Clostridia bacterium]|nr:energy-coupling factor transporter ATPase [Clostridia bacterium]
MRVESKDLTFIYGEGSKNLSVTALDKVSLTVEEGEFFGIIGQTGSGKTTFVQHLNGLIKVGKDKGSVIVGEYNLSDKKCDFKSLRAKVGMVFQYPEYQLFAETVKDDVAFGLKNFAPNMPEGEREKLVREAVETVGLNYDRIKEKSPFELSGGQKRRVAIAGVIVTKPEVLVLDEPAAGLDPVGKREFIELLHKLHGAFVKTIILVSHDMNLVSENCTRAAIFSHGKIHSVGTPKEIFSRYDELVELGLDLPVTASLTRALKENGIEIDSDLTVDGFIESAAKIFAGEK